ncbi:hypothetical protein WBG78_24925 [Chryseolinea sp. T2]|uniref:hypothetical protein n=1 Tax=Chryseolinea sp. T2 TaxID=3129255 RepID=UPI0030768CE8
MTFYPVLPLWLVAVLLTALLIYSMIIEWRRPLRFLALRLASCVLAVLSLAFIVLRPSTNDTTSGEAVLLTNGFSERIADSLRMTFPHATFYRLGEKGIKNSVRLSSYRDLFNSAAVNNRKTNYHVANDHGSSNVSSSCSINLPGDIIAIAGEGLPSYALDSIHGGFHYFPSAEIDGIISVELPQKLTTHEVATISGKYRVSNTANMLYFSGPAGKIDSLRLVSPGGRFSFAFTPRSAGRVIYSLSIKDSLQSVTNDVVPLVVGTFVPLNILLLQDFPTFEMQHLKSFLSDRGHKIAMRAQLSRNIVRTEFANRQSVSLNRLTVPLLDEFDLLIVDPSTLSKLSPPEHEAVETAMNSGLGMLAVYNGEPSKALPKELLPVTFAGVASDTTSVVLHGKQYTLPATRFRPANMQQPMQSIEAVTFSGNASRVLSGYTPIRKGMAGFQLLRETYSILMAGDSLAYGQLWSPLLEAIARPVDSPGSIQLMNAFPASANDPLQFNVMAGTTPALFADSTQISVAEDMLIDDVWHATVWQDRKGWHEVRTKEDTLSYYVFNDGDWKALRISEQKYATSRASMRPSLARNQSAGTRPVSLIPFFIVFLLAAGFLWLAPKL